MNKKIEEISTEDISNYSKSISDKFKGKKFNKKSEMLKFIHEIDMTELLGVKKNDCCIFHDDEKSSASIYKTKSGIYKYKCHSSNCEIDRPLDYIDVVEKLQKKGFSEALSFIIKSLDLSFQEDDIMKESVDIQASIETNKKFIEFCEKKKSNALKIIGKNLDVLLRLYEISLGLKFQIQNNEGIVIGASNKEINNSEKERFKPSKATAILAYFGFIEKLSNYQISTQRQNELINQRNKDNMGRNINQIKIRFFHEENFEEDFASLEEVAKKWKKNKYTIAEFNFSLVAARDDVYVANKLFPNK